MKDHNNRAVLKNKHLFYSSSSSDESDGEEGGESHDPIEDFHIYDEPANDLSITESELFHHA